MRKFLLILICLFPLWVLSQDNRPILNIKQETKSLKTKGYNISKYPGYKIKIGIGIFRIRTFGNDLQFTYIIGYNKQIRFYLYYDCEELKPYYQISLRYFL